MQITLARPSTETLSVRTRQLAGIGEVIAVASRAGLRELRLPAGEYETDLTTFEPSAVGDRHLDRAEAWLAKLAAGRDPGRLPAIDLMVGDFRRSVLSLVAQVPWGETTTYGEIASRIASSPRPVGGAVGANPLPLIVPCHRVLAANGRLGGFSGGLALKRHLLALEGISWRE